MLHSLRLRLLLTMMTVVAVTAGTVALLAQQTTLGEFQRFLALSDERSRQLGELFTSAGQLHEQSANQRQASIQQIAQQVGDRVLLADQSGTIVADSQASLLGRPISEAPANEVLLIHLTDPNAYSAPALPMPLAQQVLTTTDVQVTALVPTAFPPADQIYYFSSAVTNELAANAPAMLQVSTAPVAISWSGLQGPDPVREGFISGVNYSLLLAVGVAGLAALLLTAALSRRIIRPVEQLTAAAEIMARGDLSHRVPVGANDEIGGLGRAFNSMAGALQRAETLRRTMVGDVAHELRTPLTNIRGYLEAIRDGVARPDAKTIDSLHEEALLLNRLIDDLQDLALADAGQLRLQRQPTNLAPLLEQAIGVFRPRLEARGIACRTAIPLNLPLVCIDGERIGQVVRNLLNNALTHTPASGTVSITLVQTELGNGTAALAVTVADSGEGIAAADLPLIFERFYRADPSRNRATGGSGLGLTIVRQLVEAHGGTITAESAPGQGARFTFTLPQMGGSDELSRRNTVG
jgi:signal transduction histidine kinase